MASILSGADSTDASAMSPGLDVYCGYAAGSFTNIGAVKASYPGKLYYGFVPYVTNVADGDCLDIENGDAVPADAPVFLRQWTSTGKNSDKPGFYASESVMPAVTAALSGIPRSEYYLIVALWDDNPAIPAGYDGKQYRNEPNQDLDSFYDYVFTAAKPSPPPPPPSVKNTRVQVEYYKDGFGWVYPSNGEVDVPVSSKVRVRASNGAWSDWTEISPS